jgi:hypothetical protein
MTTQSLIPALFPIVERPDLLVDACLCDEQRHLVFLSLWGRDTAVQEFLGRLTLGAAEDGLTGFHLETDTHGSLPVQIGNINLLNKRNTRELQRTLFGTLNHLWLFDRRCLEPDKPNASALAIFPKSACNLRERLWRLVMETCPLPLLDHWGHTVLDVLDTHSMLTPLPVALGPLAGFRLSLDVPILTHALGDLIRNGVLGIVSTSDALTPSTVALRHAA